MMLLALLLGLVVGALVGFLTALRIVHSPGYTEGLIYSLTEDLSPEDRDTVLSLIGGAK